MLIFPSLPVHYTTSVRYIIGVPRPKRKKRDHTGIQKSLYMTIHSFMRAMAGELEMRVTKKWPHINGTRVWQNLSAAPILESTRIVRFRVIHGLIPTNERLQRIRMVQTNTCRKCKMKDTHSNIESQPVGREVTYGNTLRV